MKKNIYIYIHVYVYIYTHTCRSIMVYKILNGFPNIEEVLGEMGQFFLLPKGATLLQPVQLLEDSDD